MGKTQLQSYLNRYAPFSTEEIDIIYNNIKIHEFRKKEFLLNEGNVCRSRFFITKGLTRTWRLDSKGNEKILHFAIENWWVSDLESFILEKPAQVNIQAIENTSVLELSKTNLEALYLSIPQLERAFRIITEKTLIALERKNEFYLKMESNERYKNLLEHIPKFIQRVPQYMIASYLDITPEYLSELRKQK